MDAVVPYEPTVNFYNTVKEDYADVPNDLFLSRMTKQVMQLQDLGCSVRLTGLQVS